MAETSYPAWIYEVNISFSKANLRHVCTHTFMDTGLIYAVTDVYRRCSGE